MRQPSRIKSRYITIFLAFLFLVFSPFKDTIQNLFVYFAGKTLPFSNNKCIQQIEELKKKNLLFAIQLKKLKHLKEENEKLRKALNLQTEKEIILTGAEIIYFTPSIWHKSALINKGTNEGIKEGQFVVDENGSLLGKITEVKKEFSHLTFVNDSDFSVPVSVGKKSFGLLEGNLSGAKILYIEDRDQIKAEDEVRLKIPSLTFSVDIGKIKKIRKTKNSLFWDIDVDLFINDIFFDKIFVIK